MIDVEVLTPQPLNVGIPPVGTVIKGRDGENGKSPYIGERGTWMVFDDAAKEWVDTGVLAGDTGEVRPGEPGKDGEDGFSPVAKVDKTDGVATFTVTDKTGTTSVQILDGRDGLPGKDGDTPQKGVDYWTEADKKEIADALKNDFVPAGISAMRLICDTVITAESTVYAITTDKDGKALSLTHAEIHVFSADGVWTDAGYVSVNGGWANAIFCGNNTVKTSFVEYDTMLKIRKSYVGIDSQQVSTVYQRIFDVDTIKSIHVTPNGGKIKAGVRFIVAGY